MNSMVRPGKALAIGCMVLASGAAQATRLEGSRPIAHQAQQDSTWRDRGVVVTRETTPSRQLTWEVVVPATPEAVWNAWTDPDEIATWAAPAAAVDLRPGGTWEAHFFPDAPEGERGSDANHIISLEPGQEIVMAAGAPAEFPTVRREKTRFSVRLDPVGSGHTLVTVRQSGFKEGDEWNRAFEQMGSMNAEWLNWLYRRFLEGPIDWRAMEIGGLDHPEG